MSGHLPKLRDWTLRRLFCVALFVLVVAVGPILASDDKSSPPATLQGSQFDDPLEIHVPLRTRTQREEDHLKALALFAGGRVAEQKQDYARALYCYERAYRLDRDALPVLREIVPLAFNLDRQAEAVRYALIVAERDPSDPALLRRLAIYLAETGETERALKMYEQAFTAPVPAGGAAVNVALLHLEVGRLYFIDHQYEKASRHFQEVVKALDNPQEAGLDSNLRRAILGRQDVTYQLFGEAFLEAERLDQARSAFEKAQEAKADEALYSYNRARIEAKEKQPQQALATLQPYFDKHQSSRGTGPYQLLADSLTQLNQQDQLIERLEKLREQDPDNVPLSYFLANQYRQAKQPEKAEAAYRALIDRNRERPPIEAFGGLIELYHQSRDAEKLLPLLGEALRRGAPLGSLGESGRAVAADDKLVRAILAVAREQIANEPSRLSHGARITAAKLAVEAKDYAGADTFYGAAMQSEPSKATEILTTWAMDSFLAHRYPLAVDLLQQAIEASPAGADRSALYFYLSGALEMMGRSDEAFAAAKIAAEKQPDSPRFQSRPAWIAYHAKRYDEARRGYTALVERFGKAQEPADARDVLREARLTLSNLAVIAGNMPEAEEWLELVLDEFPDDPGAENDLGYLWADGNKNLERALDMTRRAVAAEPDNRAFRDSLGWTLYRLGRSDEAIVELKKAAEEDEPDGVVLDHLGDALAKGGQTSEAVAAWKGAVADFEKQGENEKSKPVREKIAKASTGSVR